MANNNTRNTRTDKPNQPIATFAQEADNLYTWCLDDTHALNSIGITADMIEELPKRTDACREAQAIWNSNKNSPNEAQRQWKLLAPQAIEFRAELLKTMRYAFRREPNLLRAVSAITKGNGYSDLIQDLNDIAFLGRQHIDLLNQISFNTSLIDVAATKSDELAELWAKAKIGKDNQTEFKQNRNKTFWHLNELVSEIRAAGKYVFRNDKNRLKGYTSTFWKRKNNKKTKPTPSKSTNV